MLYDAYNLNEEFDILDIKIFPEVLLVNGKQQLIVKTWELIEKRKSKQQRLLTKNHPFHLKTIRIYDDHNEPRAAILTEQVDTKILSKHLYETSTVQFKDSIFYFKRIFRELNDSSNYSRQGKGMSITSRSHSLDSDVDNPDNSSDSSTFSNSYLQLFKYDLAKFEESVMEGYQLVEYNNDDRTFNTIFSKNFDISDDLHKGNYETDEDFLNHQFFLV